MSPVGWLLPARYCGFAEWQMPLDRSTGGTVPMDNTLMVRRLSAMILLVLALSGCSVSINNGVASTSSASKLSDSSGAPAAVVYTPTPTTAPYATCQIGVSGHNARITVGGPGVSTQVCTGLLSSLGTQDGGWVVESSPPLILPTTNVNCAVPQSLLPNGAQGTITDYGGSIFSSTHYGPEA